MKKDTTMELQKLYNDVQKNINYITNGDGEIWFSSFEFGLILGYKDPQKLIKKLNKKYKKVYNEINMGSRPRPFVVDDMSSSSMTTTISNNKDFDSVVKITLEDVSNLTHNYNKVFINESGLYEMIMLSKMKNEQSEKFKKLVYEDILPSIRKKKIYVDDPMIVDYQQANEENNDIEINKKQIAELEEKIQKLKREKETNEADLEEQFKKLKREKEINDAEHEEQLTKLKKDKAINEYLMDVIDKDQKKFQEEFVTDYQKVKKENELLWQEKAATEIKKSRRKPKVELAQSPPRRTLSSPEPPKSLAPPPPQPTRKQPQTKKTKITAEKKPKKPSPSMIKILVMKTFGNVLIYKILAATTSYVTNQLKLNKGNIEDCIFSKPIKNANAVKNMLKQRLTQFIDKNKNPEDITITKTKLVVQNDYLAIYTETLLLEILNKIVEIDNKMN